MYSVTWGLVFCWSVSTPTGLDNLYSFRDKQILQEPFWMLAFTNVFAVKSIWRIRLNEKIFDFRVLALNVFVTSDVLRVFHSSFEELLTVRLLFISYHSIWSFQGTYARQLPLPNGDGGIRTLDPLLARQVLSQLSYTPIMGYTLI